MKKVTCKVFGQRFCTYCGRNKMYYFIDGDGHPFGSCSCGNEDYCDHETVEQVKQRFGAKLKPADIDTLELYTD